MLKHLEAKHELFNSVNEMIAPETLSDLTERKTTRATEKPIAEHGGVSGSQMSFIETDAGRYFMKRMSMELDCIMVGSNDMMCRSVALWQYGVLDQLRPMVEHKIIACARDSDGWAILMEDLQTSLISPDKPLASEYVLVFLDALAHIHATFCNDQRLADPMLGLMDTSTLLECFSPLNAQRYAHYTNTTLPTAIIGGWDVLSELVAPEVYAQIRKLFEDPKPLLDAVAPFPRTLTHGDYRPANVANDGHTCIAFDWQLSAYSLMIFDLMWFVRNDSVIMATISVEEAIEIYRQQLETYLQDTFDDRRWQAMIDLGLCMHALRSLCFPAFFSTLDESSKSKKKWLCEVQSKAQCVVNASKWL